MQNGGFHVFSLEKDSLTKTPSHKAEWGVFYTNKLSLVLLVSWWLSEKILIQGPLYDRQSPAKY
jgi:hypothetical protein